MKIDVWFTHDVRTRFDNVELAEIVDGRVLRFHGREAQSGEEQHITTNATFKIVDGAERVAFIMSEPPTQNISVEDCLTTNPSVSRRKRSRASESKKTS